MENKPKTTKIELFFSDKDKYNFTVYKMSLQEGISQISRAELTCYMQATPNSDDSKNYYKSENLKFLLDKNITIKLIQPKSDEYNQQRHFSGIITEVRNLGRCSFDKEGNTKSYTFCCVLVVETPIVNLKYSHSGFSFVDKKPSEILEEIIHDSYQINLVPSVGDNTNYEEANSFYQNTESDYDFILKILAHCGLNYVFISGTSISNNSPSMVIFPGIYPLGDHDLTIPTENNVQFSCCNSTDSTDVLSMDKWAMTSRVGVDYLAFKYFDDSGELKSVTSEPESDTNLPYRKQILPYSPYGLGYDNKSAVESTICDSIFKKLTANKQVWQGETACIDAILGDGIDVSGFYGSEDDSKSSAIVISSLMNMVAEVPEGSIELSPECSTKIYLNVVEKDEGPIHIPMSLTSCMSLFGRDKKSTPPIIGTPETTETTETTGSSNIHIATVSTVGGDSSINQCSSLSEGGYKFHAKLSTGVTTPVQLVMPLGGEDQGIFRVPRLGERILTILSNGVHYLLGYLPSETVNFDRTSTVFDKIYNTNKMTIFRHKAATSTIANYNEQTYTSAKSAYAAAKDAAKTEAEAYVAAYNAALVETKKIYTGDSEQNAQAEKEATAAAQAVCFAPKEQIELKDKLLSRNVTCSELGMYTGATEHDATVNDLTTLASTGDMQVAANETMYIDAKNMSLKCSGTKLSEANGWVSSDGQITIDDFNDLKIEASHSITFAVGNNKISITKSGISIRAQKWSGSPGPLDSAIYMDGLTGVAISGANCSMRGSFGSSIGDSVGGGVVVSNGTASVTGLSISIATENKTLSGVKFSKELACFVLQLISFIKAKNFDNKIMDKATYALSGTADWGIQSTEMIMRLRGFPDDNYKNINIIASVFKIIAMVINECVILAETFASEGWLNEPAAGSKGTVTNRDAFRLAAFCFNAGAWGLLSGANIVKSKRLYSSKLQLTSDKLSTDARNLEGISATEKEYKSFSAAMEDAAVDIDVQEDTAALVASQGG